MKRFLIPLALAVASVAAVPAAAPAAKKKPKPPVYTIHGGYDKTFVIYSECDPLKQGLVKETTRTKKHYSYTGDTKRGFTITETEQQFLIRESANPYLPSNTITGEPTTRTKKVAGSDVLAIKKSRGTYIFDGIGAELQRQSFSVPSKVGGRKQIKLSTTERASSPATGCTVLYEDSSVDGTVLITRIK
jgi:hypothetical protein